MKLKTIPKRVWILWYQGFSEAPFIVKKCVDSWITRNPTWEVVLLDQTNIGDYADLGMPEITVSALLLPHRADLFRLALLAKHGGVWADATTFCVRPLDDWLEEYCDSGFFAFSNPGKDRLMSNWFMVAEPACLLVGKLYERLKLYLTRNNFPPASRRRHWVLLRLSGLLNQSTETTKYWFHPIVTKLLRVYPYFFFHYMFERLVSTDKDCRLLWMKTKRFSADIPHMVQTIGLFAPADVDVRQKLDSTDAPLFKLSWKYKKIRYTKGSLLHYILEVKNWDTVRATIHG